MVSIVERPTVLFNKLNKDPRAAKYDLGLGSLNTSAPLGLESLGLRPALETRTRNPRVSGRR